MRRVLNWLFKASAVALLSLAAIVIAFIIATWGCRGQIFIDQTYVAGGQVFMPGKSPQVMPFKVLSSGHPTVSLCIMGHSIAFGNWQTCIRVATPMGAPSNGSYYVTPSSQETMPTGPVANASQEKVWCFLHKTPQQQVQWDYLPAVQARSLSPWDIHGPWSNLGIGRGFEWCTSGITKTWQPSSVPRPSNPLAGFEGPISSGTLFILPIWLIPSLLLLWPTIYFVPIIRRRLRVRRLLRQGLCLGCGYDLRGSRAAGSTQCPECGRIIGPEIHPGSPTLTDLR